MSYGIGRRYGWDLAFAVAMAVAVAGSCSSHSTHSLGTSRCFMCSPKNKERKERKKENHAICNNITLTLLSLNSFFGLHNLAPAKKAVLYHSLSAMVQPMETNSRNSSHLSLSLSLFFFFFWLCPQKFPGQGSNLCHSSDPSQCSDNARSLTHWATRELPIAGISIQMVLEFRVHILPVGGFQL